MDKAFIYSIGLAVPENKVLQRDFVNFLINKSSMEPSAQRLAKTICYKSGIQERYSVLPDFSDDEDSGDQISFNKGINIPSVGRRMKIFEKKALELSLRSVEDCFNKTDFKKENVTHLITFSCTGMSAPGIDTGIVEGTGLKRDVERTCINFMGCYAAIVALKTAYHTVRSKPGAVVLLAGVELCSLHHSFSNDSEQLVANAIFSDGAAAVLISGKDAGSKALFELVEFHSVFAPSGKNEMTWRIGDISFELYLSSYVPKLLDKELEQLTKTLLEKVKLEREKIDHYAIHPGGMAILRACENALKIKSESNSAAYKVLGKYGNMSSVTILFVLEELLKEIKGKDKNIVSFAFGPGLTMESMLLKSV